MNKANTRTSREAQALRENIRKRNLQKNMRSQINDTNSNINNIYDENIIIHGGIALKGDIKISGAKNSALPLIFASILSNNKVVINNIPRLSDIMTSIKILQDLNAKVTFTNNTIEIIPESINSFKADSENISLMRASFLVLGPLLAKHKIAKIALPGGCSIGKRPVDIHLQCLKQLGAEIIEESQYITVKVKDKLKGANITMLKFSVGATENLIMAAVLAEGKTNIINPAKEPEITDLCKMLNQMGAKITGYGTDLITIEGVKALNGTTYEVCPDRIEAGSYAIAAAITKGELTLSNINYNDIRNILEYLEFSGSTIYKINNSTVRISSSNIIKPVDITTAPYPGFPTDMQPQWGALMTQSNGVSRINETVFENRLGYIKELKRMGANINIINPHEAIIYGGSRLKGATTTPNDLRASFALILAGLVANGITTINKLDYLDRGYENLVEKLTKCGANITRINKINTTFNNLNLEKAILNQS